ncbi:hypothetical protein WR25_25392 isoform C [Diploscapter pachys]|uniref:DUF7042 domain-containing protein n=1 Tax=Diploscapter pachys TaxID=2018661 RepID=A0A2A2JRN4_9BILA|nr:hypothetical protein WR25_25392 isoform B [Diploscapter pachys]PAV64325.1 hypothetical protein WR25_25392 isoform C [Diploscapter pachys]
MPLNFTYQTSYGACRSRTSKATNCAQQNRLIFDYKACPEIPNKEETRVELECIGIWRISGLTAFAVRMADIKGIEHRCYLMEGKGTTGRIGISADSSCEELTSIDAAISQISYKMDTLIQPQCEFSKLTFNNNKKKKKSVWESTSTGRKQIIRGGVWISAYKGKNDTVMQCLETRTSNNESQILRVYTAKGCETGFQCIRVRNL